MDWNKWGTFFQNKWYKQAAITSFYEVVGCLLIRNGFQDVFISLLLTEFSCTRHKSNHQNSGANKVCPPWKPWLQTMSSVPVVSECDTQRHWLWSGSHNGVSVQPAEVGQGAKRSKPWESFSGQQKTPIEAMCYLLKLSSIESSQKVELVKVCLRASQNPKNLLHDAVKEDKGCRQARGKWWMDQAEQSIQHVCSVTARKGLGKTSS